MHIEIQSQYESGFAERIYVYNYRIYDRYRRNVASLVVLGDESASKNRQERLRWKLSLTRRLYQQGYQRQDVINLFRFIDWVMSLPESLEQEFWREVVF